MANNRMWLVCGRCWPAGEPRSPANDDAVFRMAKYYPSSGWYAQLGWPGDRDKLAGEYAGRLDAFFDAHAHDDDCGPTMYGPRHFRLEFEESAD